MGTIAVAYFKQICYYIITEGEERNSSSKTKKLRQGQSKKPERIIKMAKVYSAKYVEVKASLKAQMESEGKKYPANKNGLSDDFICNVFAPELELDDIIKIDSKRKELKAKGQSPADGENAKVGNWFPAFRSWVGEEYFPEFSAKKSSKKQEDKNGKKLAELIAAKSKANH